MSRLSKKVGRSVLISIHPKWAEQILNGRKVLEFRRAWATSSVDALVIYATSPRQQIVAIARVAEVHRGSPTALWELAREKAGGVSRRELYSYFRGKKLGFAIELTSVIGTNGGLDPRTIFREFHPPQSFHYLPDGAYQRVCRAAELHA